MLGNAHFFTIQSCPDEYHQAPPYIFPPSVVFADGRLCEGVRRLQAIISNRFEECDCFSDNRGFYGLLLTSRR